ncbi:MAG: hypothetical protein ABIF92_00380 [archaeon]
MTLKGLPTLDKKTMQLIGLTRYQMNTLKISELAKHGITVINKETELFSEITTLQARKLELSNSKLFLLEKISIKNEILATERKKQKPNFRKINRIQKEVDTLNARIRSYGNELSDIDAALNNYEITLRQLAKGHEFISMVLEERARLGRY